MFNKILIANRGEIACRVMRTAQAMAVRTVAVYSDADADSMHVKMADEAVHIGPSAVAESYLRADKIIAACQRTGAQAVHPGYGFLSENPDFVDALNAAGIAFIGPSADAIRAMGLKDAAKALMIESGVPVVPGYHGESQDPAFLSDRAAEIGYPVLIKARAGGGGKGMRRVDDPADFKESLAAAQREGQASFGDSRCLIEKYLVIPRHIEVQVFGDSHGNVVHLFERDCSLQRRHQKVIEEAPAPGVDDAMRAAIGAAAVKAAQAISYEGAGTVEFIADVSEGLSAERFYFMEMNTRLQVEHPVTEAITGQDLVAWQLKVAAGEPLPLQQSELQFKGWAFEARLYAEDVPAGFLPATGTLAHLDLGGATARVDTGVTQGDTISPHYDPMIAKIIAAGSTRAEALNALASALADCRIAGATTNLQFLQALCANGVFRRAEMDTGLIDRELDTLIAEPVADVRAKATAALALLGHLSPRDAQDPWARFADYRHWGAASQKISFAYQGQDVAAEVSASGHDFTLLVDDEPCAVQVLDVATEAAIEAGRAEAVILLDGLRLKLAWAEHDQAMTVFVGGEIHEFELRDALWDESEEDGGGDVVLAPMPGLVTLVSAEAGQNVSAGDVLLILEAMKMEHSLRAPRDGVVAEVLVAAGEQVEAGSVLVALEPSDE